ncbi:hypothetical protein MM221_15080 [Salipaludibacillus sp. LMS25]|uniref:DUF7674 family protein n=1 Tax=Salipaludibacillus sp. LMS25 TaxID=2924031 RepID=UPI0020D19655|nr:hypothetical protein [Salipaludibacillus sp. LMS25]UTR13922.1 hypothetical protein MM221_15080 [Salipaludibacillus sp. LMS25]
MEYGTVVVEMLKVFPELRELYEEELEDWDGGDPGAHNIFGDIFNPYLIKQIKEGDEVKMKQVFHFLEKMAVSEDELVQEVLVCTVLEYLGDERSLLSKAHDYMEYNTKKLSDEIEKGLGRK